MAAMPSALTLPIAQEPVRGTSAAENADVVDVPRQERDELLPRGCIEMFGLTESDIAASRHK
jgi:hypothetical protein